MHTPEYIEFIRNEEINKIYRDCIKELVDRVVAENAGNVEAVLLYGGIVRDRKCIDGWSDIDAIVVFRDIEKRSGERLASLLDDLEKRYSIRIDLTQFSLIEVTDKRLCRFFYNSEVINALSMRENVSIVVFGHIPHVALSPQQEKQAAIFYLTNTLGLFRRYLVEDLYRRNGEEQMKTAIKRVTRWTFSIIRASLRLFDIYTHPYDSCFPHLRRVFPELDLTLLEQLNHTRKNFNIEVLNADMICHTELFVERYVRLALRRYYDEVQRY